MRSNLGKPDVDSNLFDVSLFCIIVVVAARVLANTAFNFPVKSEYKLYAKCL